MGIWARKNYGGHNLIGAGGENRTPTGSPPLDFESKNKGFCNSLKTNINKRF